MSEVYSEEEISAILRLAGLELAPEAAARHLDELARLSTLNRSVAELGLQLPIPVGRPWAPNGDAS